MKKYKTKSASGTKTSNPARTQAHETRKTWKKTVALAICMAGLMMFISCKDSGGYDPSEPPISGTQSPMGEVGNTFTFRAVGHIPWGGTIYFSGVSAEVVENRNGVSTLELSVGFSDPTILSVIAEAVKNSKNNVIKVTETGIVITQQYRMTDKGIQSVHPDGNLTMVRYDGAKVGDVYSNKVYGDEVTRREVTHVSDGNDYDYWIGYESWRIKVIKIEETGEMMVDDINRIEYVFNHKFGIVSLKIVLESGVYIDASAFSDVINE